MSVATVEFHLLSPRERYVTNVLVPVHNLSKGLFTVSVSDRDSDFLQLLALANCIHSEC